MKMPMAEAEVRAKRAAVSMFARGVVRFHTDGRLVSEDLASLVTEILMWLRLGANVLPTTAYM